MAAQRQKKKTIPGLLALFMKPGNNPLNSQPTAPVVWSLHETKTQPIMLGVDPDSP